MVPDSRTGPSVEESRKFRRNLRGVKRMKMFCGIRHNVWSISKLGFFRFFLQKWIKNAVLHNISTWAYKTPPLSPVCAPEEC